MRMFRQNGMIILFFFNDNYLFIQGNCKIIKNDWKTNSHSTSSFTTLCIINEIQ